MDIKKLTIDTDKFAINPKSNSYITGLMKIPEYVSFNHKLKFELMTYIILIYDKYSSIRRDLTMSYVQKKRKCLEICTLIKGSKIPGDIIMLLAGQDVSFCKLVAYYISLQHSPELFVLAAYDVAINSAFLNISENSSVKTIESLVEKYMDIEKNLFGGDELIGFKEALTSITEEYKNDFRVESVAEMLEKDGKLPDSWNRYGENYKPGELKFVGDGTHKRKK